LGIEQTDSLKIDFSRDIRPILSDACFSCHGPDEQSREADLRLDTLTGLTEDLGETTPVVPGNSSESELIRRINASDPSELMPPPESNKSLTASQRELLAQWIDQGAHWEQHWAFTRPVRATPPVVEQSEWCLNEIDRFILAKVEEVGLTPSSEASPYTLVRRLYLDLIGLPPTPKEADGWIARIWPGYKATEQSLGGPLDALLDQRVAVEPPAIDESEYQQLVSFLLDSPHYGERWARRWLDLARYADTNGYEKDRERSIWPYRDWVINALNEDMPFDQFTIEQIAGDMLPQATLEQQTATGFHRNTMLNEEGGIDPLEFRFHAMTDRVATTGTTWLGLTLSCCQCHTHKYDPITHTNYYQIMALLNNADEPQLELPAADFERTWRANRIQAQELQRQLRSQWPLAEEVLQQLAGEQEILEARRVSRDQAFHAWLQDERARTAAWTYLRPLTAKANLPILTIEGDASVFASGDTAKRDDYYLSFTPSQQVITAIRLEALPDERLPARGPGSTYYEGTLGDFYLVELDVGVDGKNVKLESASETYARNRFGKNPASAADAIDGDIQSGWSVHERQGERHVAVFVLAEPVPAGASLDIHMAFGRHFASSLGKFRFSATAAGNKPLARSYTDAVAQLIHTPEDQLTDGNWEQLLDEFLMLAPELTKESEAIRKLLSRPEVPTTMVLAERPPEHTRPTFRHHRGEYLQAVEQVEPGVPELFPPLPSEDVDRLGFAKWLVAEDNPLTARVLVNRQWAAFFGTGIVKTVNDFGLQGTPPSHPELLDWLATSWMQDDRWSLKSLHRRIVSSRTYRQSSVVKKASLAVDPNNRLLSYAPRLRLEAELLRDSLLVAADVLVPKLGGPPVRPPQAEGITEVAFGSPHWNASQGEDRFRRSLYTFIKRTAPYAMFATFDAPSGEACIAIRERTNNPLQSLTLLNDVMIVELAKMVGQRFSPIAPSTSPELSSQTRQSQLLKELFRSLLVRSPRCAELRMLNDFLDAQRLAFTSNPSQAADLVEQASVAPSQLATPSESSLQADSSPRIGEELWPGPVVEQAAWIAVARTLIALDETQTRE
jgi:hypothetical protein